MFAWFFFYHHSMHDHTACRSQTYMYKGDPRTCAIFILEWGLHWASSGFPINHNSHGSSRAYVTSIYCDLKVKIRQWSMKVIDVCLPSRYFSNGMQLFFIFHYSLFISSEFQKWFIAIYGHMLMVAGKGNLHDKKLLTSISITCHFPFPSLQI